MKLTINVSERELKRALAFLDCPEEQADKIEAALPKYANSEIDLTDFLDDENEGKQARFGFSLYTIGQIAQQEGII